MNIQPRIAWVEDAFLLIARLFMALPFLVFGPMKYLNMGKMQSYIEAGGLPGEVIWLVIPLQILGGLGVATGLFARTSAVALGLFSLLATCIYHTSWSKSGELAQFTKDFAMAGGFTFLWLHGPGRFSMDALLRHSPQGRLASSATQVGSARQV